MLSGLSATNLMAAQSPGVAPIVFRTGVNQINVSRILCVSKLPLLLPTTKHWLPWRIGDAPGDLRLRRC